MKKIVFVSGLLLLAAFSQWSCDGAGGGGSAELESELDSMSYAIGGYFGEQFKGMGVAIDADQMKEGFSDAFDGSESVDETEVRSLVRRFQDGMAIRQGAPYSESDPIPLDLDSLSYAVGADFGLQMKTMDVELNVDPFGQGIEDMYEEGPGKLTTEQQQAQVDALSSIIQAKQRSVQQEKAAENLEIGEAFLAEKAAEEGVQSTPSGLHYKVLEEGSGTSPSAEDKVTVHYEGRLIDGTIFDSSYKRGQPATFNLNQVIRGWTEGVQLMKPNAKYQFYIPAELAYGNQGSPPNIEPGETLIFDVELLEVQKQ